MRARLGWLAASAALVACAAGREAGPATSLIAAEIDEIMLDAMTKREMPGAALVVIDSGRVILSRGYGYADLAKELPFTDSSHFIVGSTSKAITAIAVLKLVARQQLALDTPIVRYVPDVEFTDPRGNAITLRHLLTNRSGIVAGFSGAAYRSPPIQDSAALGRLSHAAARLPLRFAPGTDYLYSNRGFAVAGYVVERVARIPIEEFLDREVFGLAGMKRTTLRFWEVPDIVQGYSEGRKTPSFPRPPSVSREYGPSGMVVSTPYDVGLLLQALMNSGTTVTGSRLLEQRLIDEMFRPQADAESELGGATKYGLGWETGSVGGMPSVQKAGSVAAMATIWFMVPARQLAIALFMNREDYGFAPVLSNLIAVMFGQPTQPILARTPPPEPVYRTITLGRPALLRWVGEYDTRNGETRVLLRGDSLWTDYDGVGDTWLAPLSDSTFALANDAVEHTGKQLGFRRQGGRRTIWLGADSLGVAIRR